MRLGKIFAITLVAACLFAMPLESRADNGSYTYAAGAFTAGVTVGQDIAVSGATMSSTGAVLTFNCPVSTYSAGTTSLNWTCAGGKIAIASANSSVLFQGTFVDGSMTFFGSGGGRGGHVTYWYTFSGSFSGTVRANGISQAVIGSVTQSVRTGAQLGAKSAPVTSGSFGWSSAYGPIIAGDNAHSQLVSADNLTGANLIKFGSYGNGTGQFEAIAGLAQDPSRRIYVSDSTLNRIVRVDNMQGANWASLGSTGIGAHHFNVPLGVAIDGAGKIWVADSGNNRIVRFDDISGVNWTSFGTMGSGANQFSSPSAIAFDATGRIYVADKGNNRVVRLDDLKGTNWTTLTSITRGAYSYRINSPTGVAVSSKGTIYVSFGASLFSMPDMTGMMSTGSMWTNLVTGFSVDPSGTVYIAGSFSPVLGVMVDSSGTGYVGGGLGIPGISVGAVLAAATSTPPPAEAVLAAMALAYGNQNVGEPSKIQYVGLQNLGAKVLAVQSIAGTSDFSAINNCGTKILPGGSCLIGVKFDPTHTGSIAAHLTVTSNGVQPVTTLALSGNGTAPTAVVLPSVLNFDGQRVGTVSGAQIVTLTNTGTGPLTVSNIVTTGSFVQTTNCGKILPPGSGCTANILFKPTAAGVLTGAFTISDDAIPGGTQQIVVLSGTGTAGAPAFTLTPESIQFADQKVNTVSAWQSITLTNSSGVAVVFGARTYPAGFHVTTTCGASLPVAATCVFQAAFAPIAAGPISGAINIPITGQAALSVGLAGTGTTAGQGSVLVASPAAHDFGQVVAGDNPAIIVTITNTSGLATAIQSHSLMGDSDFAMTAYGCPSVLAAHASCTAQITFSPTSNSPLTSNGTFTITEGSGAQTLVPMTGILGAN